MPKTDLLLKQKGIDRRYCHIGSLLNINCSRYYSCCAGSGNLYQLLVLD